MFCCAGLSSTCGGRHSGCCGNLSSRSCCVGLSSVRVVPCTAAEGVSAGTTLSPEAGCCSCTEKNDVIEHGAAAGV